MVIKYIGALVYVIDVILQGPTITSLRLMLNIVNNFEIILLSNLILIKSIHCI